MNALLEPSELPPLREGVRALRVSKGLLFHDPLRWHVVLAPPTLDAKGMDRFLERANLSAASVIPPVRQRQTQIFWVNLDQAPSGTGFLIRDQARFACVNCGTSCRTLGLGPLLVPDTERLLQLDWAGSGRDTSTFFTDQAGNALLPAQFAPDREPFLRTVEGGRCQFLRDDNLCAVHAQFGALAKPVMCRLFPYHFRASPTGVVVAIRLGECMEAERVEEGTLMAEQTADFAQMLSEHDQIGLLPPHLWLADGKLLSWSEYLALEAELLALPSGAPPAVVTQGASPAPLAVALLRFLEDRAGLGPVSPASDAQLAEVAAKVSPKQLGLQQLSPGFDAGALALEERFVRQAVFNKDLFLHGDLVQSAALLVLKTTVARGAARLLGEEGTAARAVNQSWKHVVDLDLREYTKDLDLRALAAKVARDGLPEAA